MTRRPGTRGPIGSRVEVSLTNKRRIAAGARARFAEKRRIDSTLRTRSFHQWVESELDASITASTLNHALGGRSKVNKDLLEGLVRLACVELVDDAVTDERAFNDFAEFYRREEDAWQSSDAEYAWLEHRSRDMLASIERLLQPDLFVQLEPERRLHLLQAAGAIAAVIHVVWPVRTICAAVVPLVSRALSLASHEPYPDDLMPDWLAAVGQLHHNHAPGGAVWADGKLTEMQALSATSELHKAQVCFSLAAEAARLRKSDNRAHVVNEWIQWIAIARHWAKASRHDRASRMLEQARPLGEQVGEPHVEATTLLVQAMIARHRFAPGSREARRSVKLIERAQDILISSNEGRASHYYIAGGSLLAAELKNELHGPDVESGLAFFDTSPTSNTWIAVIDDHRQRLPTRAWNNRPVRHHR